MFRTMTLAGGPAFGTLTVATPSPCAPPEKSRGELYDGPTGSRLLTTPEAGEFLGVARRTLEDWRRTGRGPTFVALSRNAVRYRLIDLEAWVESRAAPHTAKARALLAA